MTTPSSMKWHAIILIGSMLYILLRRLFIFLADNYLLWMQMTIDIKHLLIYIAWLMVEIFSFCLYVWILKAIYPFYEYNISLNYIPWLWVHKLYFKKVYCHTSEMLLIHFTENYKRILMVYELHIKKNLLLCLYTLTYVCTMGNIFTSTAFVQNAKPFFRKIEIRSCEIEPECLIAKLWFRKLLCLSKGGATIFNV